MKSSLTLLALVAAAAGLAVGADARANGSPYSPGLVQGWDGVRAPGGVVRFVTLVTPRSTVVAVVRVGDGRVVRNRILRGLWGIPIVAYDGSTGGLSGDGRTLVVGSYGPLPGSPGTTSFTVLETRTLRKVQRIELPGAWSFDAVSPDGNRLYLVEHVAAGPSPRYRVRVFDVAARRLVPRPVVDPLASEAIMRGQPATRARSRDGRWAYTLYARQGAAPFVHALDTERGRAFCIDLPLRIDQSRQLELRLALRAGGRELAVRSRGAAAPLAVMNVRTFVVHATGR